MTTIVILICIFDLVVVGGIVFAVVRVGWSSLDRRYPAREAAPDAVSRRWQSFRVGVMNLGGSIHVAVDEDYLHMHPIRVLRWLGAKPVSVPWSSITIRRRSRNGKWVEARFDGTAVHGPAWCLDLAEGETPGRERDAATPGA